MKSSVTRLVTTENVIEAKLCKGPTALTRVRIAGHKRVTGPLLQGAIDLGGETGLVGGAQWIRVEEEEVTGAACNQGLDVVQDTWRRLRLCRCHHAGPLVHVTPRDALLHFVGRVFLEDLLKTVWILVLWDVHSKTEGVS